MRVLIDPNLGDHRKTRKLANLLKLPVAHAVGHLALLWSSVMRMAETGELVGWSEDDIALGAQFKGKARAFVAALLSAGLLDRAGKVYKIHDWAKEQGEFLEKRRKWREKKRRLRGDSIESPESVPGESPESPGGVPGVSPPSCTSSSSRTPSCTNSLTNTTPHDALRLLMQRAKAAKIPGRPDTLRSYLEAWVARKGAQEVERILMLPEVRGRTVIEIQDQHFKNGTLIGKSPIQQIIDKFKAEEAKEKPDAKV